MQIPRWYPTSTVMPDGSIVVQGGSVRGVAGPGVLTPEVYTPDEGPGWRLLTGATSEVAYGDGGPGLGPDENRWWYPRAFVVPGEGTLFTITGTTTFELDPSGDGTLTLRGDLPANIANQGPLGNPVGATSTAVMYEPGKILQVGGGTWSNGGGPQGARAGFTVDLTTEGGTANPVYEATQPMRHARHWPTATVLPDGQVLVTGGGRENNGPNGIATTPEIWNPETGEWNSDLAVQQHARLYHSTALLLPDGRVMVGGGGTPGPRNYTDVEFFYPPYLFEGDELAERPEITEAPDEIGYEGTFEVGVSDEISRVTLVRSGSVTHGFNNDQRFQELEFVQTDEDTLVITAPVDATYAPPGTYMLFVFDEAGTPSVAKLLQIDPEVEMDHRSPLLVDQFEYPRVPAEWRTENPPTTVDVEPGDARMLPWDIDSTVRLVRAAASTNGGLGVVGYHLDLGAEGRLHRTVSGLQPGREYRISLRYARDSGVTVPDGGVVSADVSIGTLDDTIVATEATPSRSTREVTFGTYVATFTATQRSETLALAASGTSAGVIIDDLVIIGQDPGLDEPRVYYDFDEGEGSTSLNRGLDASTGPARLVGAAGWSDDSVFGSALSLPGGADDHVDLPDDLLAGVRDFSVSLWAKADQLKDWMPLFQIGNGTDEYFLLQSQIVPNGRQGLGATFKARPAGQGSPVEERLPLGTGVDLTPGQWTHVVFTMEGTTGTLYLNGVPRATRDDFSVTLADVTAGGTSDNYLGNNDWPDPTFDGLLDDVRLYASVLSDADVAALYADGSAQRTRITITAEPPSPASFGEPVTVSARVAAPDGSPARGQVLLAVDGAITGSALPLDEDGAASFEPLRLSPGQHTFEVRFFADEGYRDATETATYVVERPPPGEGIPIHYAFDEGEGTTAANSGWDVTVGDAQLRGNATWVQDPDRGTAVSLPGGPDNSGHYVHLPDNLTSWMTDEFSVSLWARPNALPPWVPLLQIGSGTDTFFLLQSNMQSSPGGAGFGATFRKAGDPAQERLTLGAGNDLPIGQWTHVVFTQRGSTGKIYFNGQLMGVRDDFTITIGDVGINGTTTANFLGDTSWPDPLWNGRVDDLRIYGHELSEEEIRELYEGPRDDEPPAVAVDVVGDGTASVTMTLTADDGDGSGVARIEYRIGNGAWTTYEGPVTFTEPGTYTILYRATDNADNTSDVQVVWFTVVETEPPPTDACPDGAPSDVTVDFGGPRGDSGVPNYDRGDGCTILDLIDFEAGSRSEFLRSVQEVADAFLDAGIITRNERADLIRAAAASDIGRSGRAH